MTLVSPISRMIEHCSLKLGASRATDHDRIAVHPNCLASQISLVTHVFASYSSLQYLCLPPDVLVQRQYSQSPAIRCFRVLKGVLKVPYSHFAAHAISLTLSWLHIMRRISHQVYWTSWQSWNVVQCIFHLIIRGGYFEKHGGNEETYRPTCVVWHSLTI